MIPKEGDIVSRGQWRYIVLAVGGSVVFFREEWSSRIRMMWFPEWKLQLFQPVASAGMH